MHTVPSSTVDRFVSKFGAQEGGRRVRNHARWQAERARTAVLDAQVLRTVFDRGNYDEQRRPMMVIRIAEFTEESLLDQLEQRLADLMDDMLDVSDRQADGRVAAVVDMAGFSLPTPMTMRVASRCIGTMRAQYPERLAYGLVLNAGLTWHVVWACVRPLLPERVARKVVVVDSDNHLV